MFRNPRENALVEQTNAILPSTGRPPTPPTSEFTNQSAYFTPTLSSSNKKTISLVGQTPVLGRQPASKVVGGKKNGAKQNQSILNFFGKTERVVGSDSAAAENGLFFEDMSKASDSSPAKSSLYSHSPATTLREDDSFRFNEEVTPVKRRKTDALESERLLRTPSPERLAFHQILEESTNVKGQQNRRQPKHRGGFIDESSDDEEDQTPILRAEPEIRHQIDGSQAQDSGTFAEQPISPLPEDGDMQEVVTTTKVPLKPADDSVMTTAERKQQNVSDQPVPTLNREATSMFLPGEFGEDDNFEDDEFFGEGEEFLERRWMEEQRAMEVGLEDDSKSESGTEGPRTPKNGPMGNEAEENMTEASVALCPICNGSMKGLSEAAASSHVNACLDGNATPLKAEEVTATVVVKAERSPAPQFSLSAKRFQRAAVARPAQANPFLPSSENKNQSSAFSRLMSGHAEDAAWAEAAENENQSRGKPAYQRTCPFYKIMPGLYICVDAFRYGKVEGQNAYFLSHFHSDHYIGLTSSWCHGPIYASKVTCNLMRQQLRVDPKWLHPLEFDKKTEVPNTKGVFVTMIPANHCPGSSLYLFEKVIGTMKDGSPRMTRVLHCGDFRACPAHVKHPLLRPDVIDSISGQTKQQVIDTCYLDTTYLTPKFSFPSQHDVIDACAQMCVSLSKEIPDNDDNWEKVKMERAGSVMTKFLEKGESEIVKKEEDEEMEDRKPRMRGRLLVVIGTYSIGKERICLGIARALKSKIFAPPAKMRICKALEDDELNALLTNDPHEAQVHMQTLMEIRAETLHDYLVTFRGHFTRIVGFRPTGWTYRPPTSRFTDNPAVSTVLHSEGWKSRFTMKDLAPQRGSTRESNCFGVPYSEHSSFRELTMFCCALRINRIVPTVNVGSAKSRERMKGWIEKWDMEKKKNGLFQVEVGAEGWGSGDGKLRMSYADSMADLTASVSYDLSDSSTQHARINSTVLDHTSSLNRTDATNTLPRVRVLR